MRTISMKRLSRLLSAALLPAALFGVTDSIRLNNTSGATVINYPLQFARPFVQSEIAHFPQIGVCIAADCSAVSSWLTTQADVKVRWVDGSVKHSLVSVVIPALPVGYTYLKFQDQPSCNCGAALALTQSQMLSSAFNFDATIEATQNGTTKSGSARRILADWPQDTLAVALDAASTAITVLSGSGFPPPPFHIQAEAEDMKVTAVSGTSWTVVRGANGTAAAPHASGTAFGDARVKYWAAGSVATTVVLADFSANHLYDFGWQADRAFTVAAPVSGGAATIAVADASLYPPPFQARVYRPFSSSQLTHSSDGEDIYVCAVDTTVTPQLLKLGAPGCAAVPSAAGRAVVHGNQSAAGWNVGDQIHPNGSWKEPGSAVYNSIKPVFEATFWPATNQVWVRVAAEITDTQRLQDQVYDVVVRAGQKAPAVVFSQAGVIQRHSTAWTRNFWLGTPPPTVEIQHNAAYLGRTGLMWNWDPQYAPSTRTMDADYSRMLSQGTGLGSLGPFTTWGNGSGGARPEIGPEHSWFVDWLLTGYDRARQVTVAVAEMSTMIWTGNYREGDSSQMFDYAATVNGLGKVAVPSTRKTLAMGAGYNYSYTHAADAITPIGPFTAGAGTGKDLEHLYNPHMPLYAVTGDWYYLQLGMFYGGWAAIYPNGANHSYGRGPTGAEVWPGYITRSEAWSLRVWAELGALLPDAMVPEKTLFTQYVGMFLGAKEGMLALGNSYPADPVYTNMYNWGNTSFDVVGQGERANGQIQPLGVWVTQEGGPGGGFAQGGYGIDTTAVAGASSLYEQDYMACVLGLTQGMGYYPSAVNKLMSRLATYYIGAVTDPTYNKYLLASGRVPTLDAGGNLIGTWSGMKSGFWPTFAQAQAAGGNIWQGMTAFPNYNDESYGTLATAAIAQVAGYPGGATAWAFAASQRTPAAASLNEDPHWALVPRSTAADTAGEIILRGPVRRR